MNEHEQISVYTPSRTAPEVLEFILVQREALLKDAVERVRESALTKHKHHQLFVGPRGCGKTHLVTLIVHRAGQDPDLTDRLRIAWLNEDETCTTVLELLLKIHAALVKRYPKEYKEEAVENVFDLKPNEAAAFMKQHVLDSLGMQRTLLIVAENLDAIFEGLGDAGQKELRAYLQEHPRIAIVASAQKLVEGLSERKEPFHGFFQTEHLKPLSVEDATALLQKIARSQRKFKLVSFLSTARGHSRVRALHHLSGGNHRIYIVLSRFITHDTIDALVAPFLKMVDELTPYYQERLRWLPPQQRKIIEHLCKAEGTVAVKDIAKALFATPQTISSQLQDLRDMGYVESSQRGREFLYEVSEPLMRISVEVKENQNFEPLRLLVDFLRVWYEDEELGTRLQRLHVESPYRPYLESALDRNKVEGNLRHKLLIEDLQLSLLDGHLSDYGMPVAKACAMLPEAFSLAVQQWERGNKDEAARLFEEAIESLTETPAKVVALYAKAGLHMGRQEWHHAIDDFSSIVARGSVPVSVTAAALLNRGLINEEIGDRVRGLEDYSAVLELKDASVEVIAMALFQRGSCYQRSGERFRAIEDYDKLIELQGAPSNEVASALLSRGIHYEDTGERTRAIRDYDRLVDLKGAPVDSIASALLNRGGCYENMGDLARAIEDFDRVIRLQDASAEIVANALLKRGICHRKMGHNVSSIEDYSAVITLKGAPAQQIAMAYVSRGLLHGLCGNHEAGRLDLSTVIKLPNAPVEEVVWAFHARGLSYATTGQLEDARRDFEAVQNTPEVPLVNWVDAALSLSQINGVEGRWIDAVRMLNLALERGSVAEPPYFGDATYLLDALFSAGFTPETRQAQASELLVHYAKYNALAALGEGLIRHLGNVFRRGAPFPSTDNLEQWAAAWEDAGANAAGFRLSLRLLRTGVNFLKKSGRDRGILLTLTKTEREILEQAFGPTERTAT